jgi:8-oxo-dGTP pyrophosphatase MutT (NUDIX family)
MNKIAQASALPFRIYNDKLQILIITSRNGKKWIIPKGIIDTGDTDRYTALKETQEEAGVTGKVFDKLLGTYSYEKWSSICEVKVFPLKVSDVFDKWDEDNFRKRKWVSPKRAIRKVSPREVSVLIKEFVKRMKTDPTEI